MDPRNQHEYSVDYLNSIAGTTPKKSFGGFGFDRKMLIIFGLLAGALILAVIFIIVGSSLKNGGKDSLERLSARLTTTEKLSDAAKPRLKDSKTRAINSTLKIYLTNTNRDIAAPLQSSGVNTAELSKSIIEEEAGTDFSATLETARLNNDYDRTYAREMSYRLETTLVLMNEIYNSTGNEDLKTYIQKAFTDLKPIQKDFADFNAANG